MISASDLTPIGKVVKTHGIDGEMSASFTIDGFDELVQVDSCLWFCIDGLFVPFFVAGVRSRGNESLLLTLDGEDSQQQAAAFVGLDIYMLKNEVGDEEEFDPDNIYASDLVGFAAKTDAGSHIGEITDVDDSTDNPLFIITSPAGEQVLVPVVDDFIVDIDSDSRSVTFSLPVGLLDL